MKRFNVCIKRTYTTKSGEEKTTWPRIGVAFEGDKGISGTIEMVPTGSWDGRFVLFEADETRQAPKTGATQSNDGFDDQIPF